MNRPIKFRGRIINTGILVHGDLAHTEVGIFISGWEVDPESVKQLVGYDADGREVYEDDELVNAANETFNAILLEGIYTDEGFIHTVPLEYCKLKEA